MTRTEYAKLYAQAKRRFPRLTRSALSKLKETYQTATAEVAARLRDAVLTGKAELTIESWAQILSQLQKAGKSIEQQILLDQMIDQKISIHISNWTEIRQRLAASAETLRQQIETTIPATLRAGNETLTRIHEDYLLFLEDKFGGRITAAGIQNMFVSVNDKLIASIVNRVYQDGYTYSERVWNIGLTYQDDIKRVITSGLAQGRDILEIAADLNVYVQDDKAELFKRYGKLLRGTAAFRKRVRKDVFYPSLRLIRSELYASLQENARFMGQANPACNGLYEWIRNTQEDFGCSCPENQENSPYDLNGLPDYPHPNCLCIIRPVLRDSREFQNDLQRWVSGESVGYIDNWYDQVYLAA